MEEESQTIPYTSARSIASVSDASLATPSSGETVLAQALAVFYALPPNAQAKFLRHVAPRQESSVSVLGMLKERPQYDRDLPVIEGQRRRDPSEGDARETIALPGNYRN